jgi:hypothetical protein
MGKRREGKYWCAVAARDGADLWLVLEIKQDREGGFVVLVPHFDGEWNLHETYHRSGALHTKTHRRQPLADLRRQPLKGQFRGTEHLGKFRVGHVGMTCDRNNYNMVMEVPADTLKSRDYIVGVDLVEPGTRPRSAEDLMFTDIAQEQIIDETVPNIVLRVGKQLPLSDAAHDCGGL